MKNVIVPEIKKPKINRVPNPGALTGIINYCQPKTKFRAIFCSKGHLVCKDGVPYYLEQIFASPEINIPVKGTVGAEKIDFNIIDKVLSEEQFIKYNNYIGLSALDENDEKVSCPLCNYFEIWSKEDFKIFFYCKNENCRKGTGFVCKESFNYPRDICNLTEEESEYINSGNGHHKHLKGIESMSSVEEITKIGEQQSKRFCPKGGTGGRKDEMGTHITCNKCQNVFCYFGGLSSDQADKSDPNGTIYRHNDNWQTNAKRCPMKLTEICSIDKRWPESDLDCQDFLHKLLTYAQIKPYINKIGIVAFKAIYNNFDNLQSYGIDVDEILNIDLTMIHRQKA